ncbi:MAG: superoxide dismutase [Planctomycetota bacterium]|jgi:Fe-Mn family superoxide dismutase
MAHQLPDLPYAKNALEPTISENTFNFHHGKHHAAYVTNLNAALEGTEFADMPIDELIGSLDRVPAEKRGAVFNHGCQHFNHSFYWNCMSPSGGEPAGALLDAIDGAFGNLDGLKETFLTECATHFGSGWGWLVKNTDGGLAVVSTHDADTPLAHGQTPLLTADVWEHAYYLDYQNARPKYLEAFWGIVNWEFVQQNFER